MQESVERQFDNWGFTIYICPDLMLIEVKIDMRLKFSCPTEENQGPKIPHSPIGWLPRALSSG